MPRTRVLLLDLDGTLCLGDGPALRYAAEVDRIIARTGIPDAPQVEEGLLDYLSAPGPERDAALHEAVAETFDAWAATRAIAAPAGLSRQELSTAFVAAREAMDRGEIEVYADPELVALLREVPDHVHVALATNSPDIGMAAFLDRLGVGDVLHEVATSAGKPTKMPPLLDRLLRDHDLVDHPDRLLSVGDNWRNDIAPALDRGCAGAYIDRFRTDRDATLRAETVAGLVPGIAEWMRAD